MSEKRVVIAPYAARKAGKRGLAQADIEECASEPDPIVAGHHGRQVAQKLVEWKGRRHLLRVVLEELPDRVEVVTAYRTSAIDRYWNDRA